MILVISGNNEITDLQKDFNRAYPFLKIEFYKRSDPAAGAASRSHLKNTLSIKAAGLTVQGHIEIFDTMTVAQLERIFREQFGLSVHVSRKSGILWLETTMTDNWTLKQQNDHGKELSSPVQSNPVNNEEGLEGDTS